MVLVAFLCALAGCTEPPAAFRAYVDPPTGHVPYTARVVFSSPPGTYTVELPDGTSLTTREDEIEVTVDRLEWTAHVTWTDGSQVRTADATALGTNAPPTILAPRLNGDAFQGVVRPREATLVDFTHYAAGLAGPESGVVYDGDWRIVSIRAEAETKRLCESPMADSIYTPPWAEDQYHALFRGHIWENACLLYPLYTSETAPNGRPYAPESLPGYEYDGIKNRNVLLGVGFPEQDLVISVTVQDDWGRTTSASFVFRVAAAAYRGARAGGAFTAEPREITEFEDALFFVSSPRDPLYYRSDCPEVCRIPAQDRIYFASQENAEEAGKKRSQSCFGY